MVQYFSKSYNLGLISWSLPTHFICINKFKEGKILISKSQKIKKWSNIRQQNKKKNQVSPN